MIHLFAQKKNNFRVSKTLGLLRGGCPLSFIPALTACTSERMKTFRFSYLAGFAARELMREAKPVKTRKSGVQPLFRHSQAGGIPSTFLYKLNKLNPRLQAPLHSQALPKAGRPAPGRAYLWELTSSPRAGRPPGPALRLCRLCSCRKGCSMRSSSA